MKNIIKKRKGKRKVMKKMKKVLSLILTVIMVLAMAVPSFAAITVPNGPFTITINDDNEKNGYTAYQIFKGNLTLDDKDNGSESDDEYILSNIEWADAIDDDVQSEIINALNDVITLDEDPTAAEIAEQLSSSNIDTFAEKIEPIISSTTGYPLDFDNVNKDKFSVEVSNAGYYLVVQTNTIVSVGEALSKYIIQVVGDVDMSPKSGAPTIEKKIDDGTDDGADETSLSIGDTVTFEITVDLPDGNNWSLDDYDSYKLVITDTLSIGLTYNDDAKIVLDDATILYDEEALDENNYFKKEVDSLVFTCEDIKLIPEMVDSSIITLTYTATLNNRAAIGSAGNTNTVTLTYSNDPYSEGVGTTPSDTVYVFTFELDGEKVDGDNTTTKLQGAEFILYRVNNSVNEYRYESEEGNVTWVTEEEIKDSNGNYVDEVKVVSGSDGKFAIEGLAEGDYFLEEITAPQGYNLLADPIAIKIEATTETGEDGVISVDYVGINVDNEKVEGSDDLAYTSGNVGNGTVEITVENNQGATLPSTGGIGTTIFYAAGIVLMAGAVFFVVRRKRA